MTLVLKRLGLILVGALLACLGAEIALRISGGIPEVANPLYSFHQSDPDLGWSPAPNLRLRYHRPEFDTLVEHGADGWRTPDPPRPDAATQRILVLGDSFTWGWGVSQGELFTDRLQARLPATVGVYNRGINGVGTAQEYLLLQRELAAQHYDAVLLMFFLNDVADNTDGKDGRRPYFDLVGDRLLPRNQPAAPLMSPLQRFFKDHSRAYQFFDVEFSLIKRRLAGEANDERGYREAPPVDFHDLPGAAVTARLLAEMNRVAREHGARFFVVYIPQRSEIELDTPFPYVQAVHALVDDATRRAGIPLIDLTAPFHEHTRSGERLTYAVDAHWTPAGHQLTADVLLSSPVFQSRGSQAPSPASRAGEGGGEGTAQPE